MKVTIPYAYKAQVLLPRSDTPKDEVFVETLEIDVPEYRSGDIPVAIAGATGTKAIRCFCFTIDF